MKPFKMLLVLTILLVLSSFAYSACVEPTDDLSITEDTVLCNNGGTPWQLNDSAADGLIQIGASDVTLDCNGSTIVGNGSGIGIQNNNQDNITIQGCKIVAYEYNIRFGGGSNYGLIQNNHIENYTNHGILFSSSPYNTAKLNNITETKNDNTRYAIRSYRSSYLNISYNRMLDGAVGFACSEANYINFNNNYINNTGKEGVISSMCNYSQYQNNQIEYTNLTGIRISGGLNTIIDNNNLSTISRAAIGSSCQNCNISNNKILDSQHGGITLLNINTDFIGNNTKIYGNYISGYSSNDLESHGGITIGVGNKIEIYNNLIFNLTSDNPYCTGIKLYGSNENLSNNYIFNNTINFTSYCIWQSGINITWESNKIANCNNTYIFIDADQNTEIYEKSNFINNIYDSVAMIDIVDEWINVSINESGSKDLILPNNGIVNFTSSIRHDFSVDNNTVTVRPTPDYSFRILNVTSGLYLTDYLETTYSITVPANNNLRVEYLRTRASQADLNTCDNIMDILNNSFTLTILGVVILMSALLITTLSLVFGGEAFDMKTFLMTVGLVIILSILTLIGYFIIAKTQGAIC